MTYPRVEWDKEVNAASIYFREREGDISKGVPVEDEDGDVLAVLRFSPAGELLEVELLNAKEQMPRIFRS
ncbi:DUF2283 domain-containing protein [Amycolatopsis arida]|uniref:DUF2283 domain-containing protein n=1 Tax=Amycolatopsis arida TaxID=587909 RepID=UPI000B8952E5|nr:DUF2283 domain-containing protein [Amycolatopsis arida]